MGSTRFPGKMLADLGGHSILEWVLRRSSRARMVDQVILATTELVIDDALAEVAQKLGFEVFRGNESDVLSRFAAAATIYNANVVVRICADNPFIDPDEIDRLVGHFQNNQCDYAFNHQGRLGSRYSDGFGAEILSNRVLQQLSQKATDVRHLEHVTLYIWENAQDYLISPVPPPQQLAYPELRFDVDQMHDLAYLQTLIDAGVNINSSANEIVQIALNSESAILVTTDINLVTETKQSNVYYLGAWCFLSRHDEKHAESEGKVIPYHWNDRGKLKRDYDWLGKINEDLLDELLLVLNELHGLNENKNFWRLLLGYWLNIYTAVIFDRWASLGEAVKLRPSWQTEVFPIDEQTLAVADTEEFIQTVSESSKWNHSLFVLIARYFPEIKLIPVNFDLTTCARSKLDIETSILIKHKIKYVFRRAANWLKVYDRFCMISSYLPPGKMARLEISLGQPPLPRTCFGDTKNPRFDPNWRKWSLPNKAVSCEFNRIVRILLPKFLPRIFLEGFRDLLAHSNALPWPKSPDVIFTSNNHFSDDVFKFWTAQKIAKGARLVIGEHGGLGPGLFNGAHRYELSVANTYLTTGWIDNNHANIKPLGYFRYKSNNIKSNPTGKALLVCGIMPRFSFDIRSTMLSSQVIEYFEDQFHFIDALPQGIKNQILVRLPRSDYGWEQKERWLDRHPTIKFDDGSLPMLDSAARCRLFISTYMATTYIESLVSNIPTIMFWNPSHWETTPEAQPYFERLKEVGIFHESAEKAASHISSIWYDIPTWWQSEGVQSARQDFCDRYAATPPDINKCLKKILLEEASLSSTRAAK